MRSDSSSPQASSRAMPVRRADLQCHELDGEAVLYSLAHHAMHYLNSTAYLIWHLCDGNTPASELPGKVAETYGISNSEEVARDTAASLASLAADGLIDWRHAAL